LTKEERKKALDELMQSKDVFVKSVKGLSKEQLNFKTSPESWSIADCAEHIAKSESFIYGMVDGSLKQLSDGSKRGDIKLSDDDVMQLVL